MLKKIMIYTLVTLVAGIGFSQFAGPEKLGTELPELMIIQSMGIDVEDEKYTVTVEILNNEQTGSANGEVQSEQKTKIYSGKGETLSEALGDIIKKNGNKPLYAHNRAVIIGEDAAKTKFTDILDFIERDYNTRATVPVAISAGGRASDIVTAEVGNNVIRAHILENVLEESEKVSYSQKMRVLDVANYKYEQTTSLVIPAIKTAENYENESYYIYGSAVFDKNNNLAGYLNEAQSMGLGFLKNEIQKGVISSKIDGRKFSVLIEKSKTEYVINTKGDIPEFTLNVILSVDLDEIEGGAYSFSKVYIEKMENAVSDEVVKLMRQSLYQTQKVFRRDCLRFGRRLLLNDRNAYFKYCDGWDDVFPEIPVNINTKVSVRRIGEISFFKK